MTFGRPLGTFKGGLPPLGGRLLLVYRLLWAALLLCAFWAMGLALTDGSMSRPILTMRIVKSLILAAAAIILSWRRPRDPVAALLSLAFLCWITTSSVDFTSQAMFPAMLDRLRFLLFVLALLLFPDGRWAPPWTRKVAGFGILICLVGLAEAANLISTNMYLPPAVLCVLLAILALIERFRQARNEDQKQQLKWVALGLVSGIGLIVSARATAALGIGFEPYALEAVFQLGIVIVALGFLIPVLRYRLYDAETVISRSAGYAILTATLVAIFAGSEALIETISQQYLGGEIGEVSGAIAASLAAVLLAPLNDRIGSWAEGVFQRDLVRLKKELPELLAEVPRNWNPRQIGRAVLPRIGEAVHASHSAILIDGSVVAVDGISLRQAEAASEGASLRLPLPCPFGGVRGWLVLGPRPDGSGYRSDDIAALHSITPALRRAMLNAIDRHSTSRRRRRLEREVFRQLQALRDRVSALEDSSREKLRMSG